MPLPYIGKRTIPSVSAEFGPEMVKAYAALGRSGGQLSEPIGLTMGDGVTFYLTHLAHVECDAKSGIMAIYGRGTSTVGEGALQKVRVELRLTPNNHNGTITFNS